MNLTYIFLILSCINKLIKMVLYHIRPRLFDQKGWISALIFVCLFRIKLLLLYDVCITRCVDSLVVKIRYSSLLISFSKFVAQTSGEKKGKRFQADPICAPQSRYQIYLRLEVAFTTAGGKSLIFAGCKSTSNQFVEIR